MRQHKFKLVVDCDSVRAMPSARSGLLRTTPVPVVAVPEPVAIAAGPSDAFIRRSRNPDLASPTRFEPLPEIEGVVKL